MAAIADRVPPRSRLVLSALILGAIVSNINLSIANVALPTIGGDLGATQDQLTSIADGFALALASTVLYLGAIGDKHGRKRMFVAGAVLTVPTSMFAAWSTSPEMLIVARVLCGLAAAMLFPTTLSLISVLFQGRPRVRAVALWSGIGAGVAALGPVIGGWLLQNFWWGSVFLIAVPLVLVALVLGIVVIPADGPEDPAPIDHLGGVLSVVGVGSLVMAIMRADQGFSARLVILSAASALTLVAFFHRQRRAPNPLVDLDYARHRTFWVAFVAGAITFGSLIGAMFVGQQFTQNVLGYDPLSAAAVVVPASLMTMITGALAGRLVLQRGSRTTFVVGLAVCAAAFALMLVTWRDGAAVGWVLAAYACVGAGVGFAATAASGSLMSSLPIRRSGMGSAFLDLTRDFGGAVIQALMGALLAGFYARYFSEVFAGLPSAEAAKVTDSVSQQLISSYDGAVQVAAQYPSQADQILATAAQAFTEGKSAAMGAGLALTLVALVLVIVLYPRREAEVAYYAKVAQE